MHIINVLFFLNLILFWTKIKFFKIDLKFWRISLGSPVEPEDEKIKSNLSKKKYLFNETTSVIGRVDAIHVDKNDYLNPGADKRGDDTAIGY